MHILAGVAIGLFFAGVFVVLIVWFIVNKTKGGSKSQSNCFQGSGCIKSHGSFQRMEDMKYDQYNNPSGEGNWEGGCASRQSRGCCK